MEFNNDLQLFYLRKGLEMIRWDQMISLINVIIIYPVGRGTSSNRRYHLLYEYKLAVPFSYLYWTVSGISFPQQANARSKVTF